MIKAIIWDIGGVLTDEERVDEFWGHAEGSGKIRELFGAGKLSIAKYVSKGSAILGISEEEFLKRYDECYLSLNKIEAVFRIFKSMHLHQYIFSNSNPIHANYIKTKHSDLIAVTEKAYFSSDIGYRKGDIDSFKFILADLPYDPEEILFIDNGKKYVEMGASLGMSTIFFENPTQLQKEMKELGIIN